MGALLKHGADVDDALLFVAQGNENLRFDNADPDPYLEFLLANNANPNVVTDKNSSVYYNPAQAFDYWAVGNANSTRNFSFDACFPRP